MDSSTSDSSNRVKVEYTDPTGIFPLISSDLHARLPLRNLHWNSPSRPLRSIDSLYVELNSSDAERPQSQQRSVSSAGFNSNHGGGLAGPADINERRGSEPFTPRKERRHQIPGLRQTPYLKVYLLRCSDSDTYKISSRKLLREWIKKHTQPSQSSASVNNSENHDAFEWMIIHVVFPDVQNNSNWFTRASSSVLDKIRADFNGSSKLSIDRVAQILATRNQVTQGATTSLVHSGSVQDENIKESNRVWDDTIGKLKALILTSFDQRVRQYEEDIRERGAQRNLPGWNFCTYFLLKEGLARGFESVGLVEDGLIGYDELSVELDNVIQDEEEKSATGQQAGLFREFTPELLTQAESAMARVRQDTSSTKQSQGNLGVLLLNTDRKPYRELIMANNISVFDFQNYVFARQTALLLRNARPSVTALSSSPRVPYGSASVTAAADMTHNDNTFEDLTTLAEICRRGISFIASAGGTIRRDLRLSFKVGQDAGEDDLATRYFIIESIVVSWTFTACQQVLAHTESQSLSRQIQQLSDGKASKFNSSQPSSPTQNYPVIRPIPLRNFSGRTSSVVGRLRTPPLVSPQDDRLPENFVVSPKKNPRGEVQTGLNQLAARRAELLSMARRALSKAGKQREWKAGILPVISETNIIHDELEEVALDDASRRISCGLTTSKLRLHSCIMGLQADVLRSALSSEQAFYVTYESMTTAIAKLYLIAGDTHSADAMTADLAAVRFHHDDFAGAASYLRNLVLSYAKDDWGELELAVLDIHAQCLQKLNKLDDYVRIALKLLAKVVQMKRQALSDKTARKPHSTTRQDHLTRNTDKYLKDLLRISKKLEQPVTALLTDFFSEISIRPYLEHFESKDGFRVAIDIGNVMLDGIYIQRLQLRLLSADEGLGREVWLSSEGSVKMDRHRSRTTVFVTSTVMVPDWYIVDKVMLHTENVILEHNYDAVNRDSWSAGTKELSLNDNWPMRENRILIWPSQHSMAVKIRLSSKIHLEQPRSIIIEINSNQNAILGGELLLKAASAGLRLHTADSELVNGSNRISDVSQPGVVGFTQIPTNSTVAVKVPYRLDSETKEITIRVEVRYRTDDGNFVFSDTQALSVALPLGVNVQDIFKQDSLFSKFSMSSSTTAPLRLLNCHLEGTNDFEVTTPVSDPPSFYVSSRQPVSMVYKILRKSTLRSPTGPLQTRLSMHIEYICLDEEVFAAVRGCFTSALAASEFSEYCRLLVPILLATLRSTMSKHGLEEIGLIREIRLGLFRNDEWEASLAGLPEATSRRLFLWLADWHEKHRIIELPMNGSTAQMRMITIPVDIPPMQVVHTARLHMFDQPLGRGGETKPVAIGQAIAVELVLKQSRTWDVGRTIEGQEPLDFTYELDANPDTWLIGGRRRAHFRARHQEVLTFPILLIPQRAGRLLYPSIDIRHLEKRASQETETVASPAKGGGTSINCDVDYQNHGESILVTPNVHSTTVSLDPEGPMGGAWLIESR